MSRCRDGFDRGPGPCGRGARPFKPQVREIHADVAAFACAGGLAANLLFEGNMKNANAYLLQAKLKILRRLDPFEKAGGAFPKVVATLNRISERASVEVLPAYVMPRELRSRQGSLLATLLGSIARQVVSAANRSVWVLGSRARAA